MRVVLDTNIVASALLWGGTPERLIELAGEGSLELFTSEALLSELAGILGRAKFVEKLRQKNLSPAEIVARYREIAETVEAGPIEEAALRRSGRCGSARLRARCTSRCDRHQAMTICSRSAATATSASSARSER